MAVNIEGTIRVIALSNRSLFSGMGEDQMDLNGNYTIFFRALPDYDARVPELTRTRQAA
tara:strand:+ start:354 stop:530 length:177 start_codon:yes stop_codon:yes gene_type:complete